MNKIITPTDKEFFALDSFGCNISNFLREMAAKCGMTERELYEEWFESKYERPPIEPIRWLNDEEHFGKIGRRTYPVIKELFYKIVTANPTPEQVILKGSIGWGKTWLSALLMCWMLTSLSYLKNPQTFFGLAEASKIVLINLSISARHAKGVLFKLVIDMIDSSPYFLRVFPRNRRVNTSIEFPQKELYVLPGSSSELAALGENIFGGTIEEANFFPVVVGSAKIHNPAERELDLAKRLYDQMWRRIKSRFMVQGKVPGMLIMNSSARYPDDFLERLASTAGDTTVVFDYAQWETKPLSKISSEKFYLFFGDQHTRPRIIEEEYIDEYKKRGTVYAVPIDYEDEFRRDMEGAIRDVLGKNLQSQARFIPDDDRILEIFKEELPTPFNDTFVHGIDATRVESAIDIRLLMDVPTEEEQRKGRIPKLKMHPNATRYVHVDLSSTGDATGFAVVHIGSVKEVLRRQGKRYLVSIDDDEIIEPEEIVEIVPIIYVDFVVRILPPEEGEIEFELLRDILYKLRDITHMRFGKISYDFYGSRESQQLLKKRFGEDVVTEYSVDRTMDAYLVLKETINEKRLKCYPYEPFASELRTLQRNWAKYKVDHTPRGSKDVADAVAGAVFHAVKHFELGIADFPQIEEFDDSETELDTIKRNFNESMLQTKTKKRTQISPELQIMKAILSGELEEEEVRDGQVVITDISKDRF